MFDPGSMAAPMPGDPAALAAMLGAPAGADGAAPAPLPPAPVGAPGAEGMPPELLAALGGGAPPAMGGMPPEAGMMPPPGANPYPTADPNFMSEALGQIIQMQQMDAGKLSADQHTALVSNPMFEALMSGAPMGPGAGQDGQALGAPSLDMPMPTGGEMPAGEHMMPDGSMMGGMPPAGY